MKLHEGFIKLYPPAAAAHFEPRGVYPPRGSRETAGIWRGVNPPPRGSSSRKKMAEGG